MYKESITFNGKITGIVEHMMYLSAKDASQLGYGYEAMKQNGITWVLSRLSMNILKPIIIGENINIMTHSCGTDRLFYYRKFEITDSEHKAVGKSMSAWIIMDTEKRVPVKNHFDKFSPVSDNAYIPPRIRVDVSKAKKIKEITVSKQHIDVNGHVNNIHYIKWMLKEAGLESISSMDINYIKEVFEGDFLELYSINEEHSIIYFLKSPNNKKISVGARLTV